MASISRVPFRRLTEAELNRPTLIPLAQNEKQLITRTLGKPPDRARFLEKHMALSVPNLEARRQYIEWYDAHDRDDQFAMMIEAYWVNNYAEEAMGAMVSSMFFQGKPTVRWVFIYNFVDNVPDEDRGSSNRQAATAA